MQNVQFVRYLKWKEGMPMWIWSSWILYKIEHLQILFIIWLVWNNDIFNCTGESMLQFGVSWLFSYSIHRNGNVIKKTLSSRDMTSFAYQNATEMAYHEQFSSRLHFSALVTWLLLTKLTVVKKIEPTSPHWIGGSNTSPSVIHNVQQLYFYSGCQTISRVLAI